MKDSHQALLKAAQALLRAWDKPGNLSAHIQALDAAVQVAASDPASEERRQKIVALADAEYGKDGELEFDSNAIVSEGDDNGAYVQAWQWVDFAGTEFDKEKEDENGKA